MRLDEKNCIILNLLQKDCRMSITDIAKQVNLSIDSTKKRIEKMKNTVFFPRIQLRPRHFGYNNIVDVKIKLRNHTNDDTNKFIAYLRQHPRIVEIFQISGSWDFSIVMIAKNGEDLGALSSEIRSKFNTIITEWAESLTTFAHKFEEYDMLKLIDRTDQESKQKRVGDKE